MNALAVYIHVPFCRKKCGYCVFVSYAGMEDRIAAYFRSLEKELSWYVERGLLTKYDIRSVYIGGGTPSLAADELVRWLSGFHERVGWHETCEVTVEVNPGTISLAQFQQLRQAGCHRVSIGVQSFHDDELRLLGRIHSAQDALRCVEAARQTGFKNLSLDLMFGLPNSSLTRWEVTLRQAVALVPEHISLYNLTIEEGTPFWEQQQRGTIALPEEDEQIRLYERGIEMLTGAGYEHYEISNCARPGYRSRHNQVYWRNEAYLGLGLGAHSYLNGTRYWNGTDLERYTSENFPVSSQKNALYPPTVEGEERLNSERTMGETLMMNLRLVEGIRRSEFQARFGQTLEMVYADSLKELGALGLIECNEDSLRLTPKGILLSNMVFEKFITT